MTIVLDDYTARSSQELSVTKGQHVRVIQKQIPNAHDWCVIRLLNEHHQQSQQNPSNLSSLAASTTTIASASADLPSTPTTKHTEGLVPLIILKSTKSFASSNQLPPPLLISLTCSKSEQGKINTISIYFNIHLDRII